LPVSPPQTPTSELSTSLSNERPKSVAFSPSKSLDAAPLAKELPKSVLPSPLGGALQQELLAKIRSQPSERAIVDNGGDLKRAPITKGKSMLLPEDRALAEKASKYKSVADASLMQHLSDAEQAFMPGDLLRRLGEAAGQLPPTPSVFVGTGAILFVDVSGFTKLSEQLRKDLVPVQAAEQLASTIRKVLETLALSCLDGGGDVAKVCCFSFSFFFKKRIDMRCAPARTKKVCRRRYPVHLG